MLPSTKERKKNAPFFHLCYADLCKLQNLMPLPGVKAHLLKNTLDFNGDRVKLDDWGPILNALSCDRSLHFIAVRSRHPSKSVLEDVDNELKARTVLKRPVLLSRFVLTMLMEALSSCLSGSTVLTCMELEGLPLGVDYLAILCKGIARCKSLQNISFHQSSIRDEGCKNLCLIIRNLPNIISVDFSNCEITAEGAFYIAEMLKFQSLHRYSESWKQTLRYRQADIDSMPGLRRITLNHNVQIGDHGVLHLVEAVKEDLWLRAVDLQNCGVGDTGALSVMDMLHINASIYIVDLRGNRKVNAQLLKQIMCKLAQNNINVKHEFQWISLDSQLLKRPSNHTLSTRRSSHSNVYNKRPALQKNAKQLPITTNPLQRSHTFMLANKPITKKPTGIPWRMDVRVKRRQEEPFDQNPGTQRALQNLEPVHPHMITPISSSHSIQLQETQLELKKLAEQLEKECALRKELQIQKKDQQGEIERLLAELQKEQAAKEGYCMIKVEAYEAIQSTFDRFTTFMNKVRKAGAMHLLELEESEISTSEAGKNTIIMKKSHSAHVKSNMKQPELSKISKSASGVRHSNVISINEVEKNIGDSIQTQRVPSTGNKHDQSDSYRRASVRRTSENKPNVTFHGNRSHQVYKSEELNSSDVDSGKQNDEEGSSESDNRSHLQNTTCDSSLSNVQMLFQRLIQEQNIKGSGKCAKVRERKNKTKYLKEIKPKLLEVPSSALKVHRQKSRLLSSSEVQKPPTNYIPTKSKRLYNDSKDESDESSVSKSWSGFSNSSPLHNHYSTDEDEY